MSDFFRRASDALHHRPRQGSTDSTEAPTSPNAAKSPEQNMLNQQQQARPDQSGSGVNETLAGDAAGSDARPKEHRHWIWGHRDPAVKQQPENQERKVDTDWILGT